jgi:hypothetical protein
MTSYGYARILRIFDEDTPTYQDALDGCGWHYREHITLSRLPPWRGARRHTKSWPMIRLPIVGVGTHVGKELVMFGACEALEWLPFDDGPRNRYKSQIQVGWENVIYRVPMGERPTKPPRGNAALSRAEYGAWRRVAVPLMDALQNPLPNEAG